MEEPTNSWECQVCGKLCERYRGQYDVTCECGAEYNASGQRLIEHWRDNPSNWDSDIGDLEGYEQQHALDY